MSTTYRNIVATVLGLALMFALAFTLAKPAQAASLSQSQVDAIINLLVSFGADQATIDNVRAALTGQPTTNTGGTSTNTGSGTCTPMVFTMNHKMGDMGGEVKNIQKFLNANGFTVAVSGPGSAGNETDYFGPATKAAVIKFQNAYASEILAPVGLTAGTGYWGNSTRAKANAMEQARCAASNSNNGGNTNTQTTADELTVASVAQPTNSLAPAGAVNVPFTRFSLTAGSSDVTVTGVKVKLQGLANRTNFASVVLLDENGMQIGRTRVLQSDYTATVGDTFTIPAGETRTFTVAANVANTVNAGEVASFAVIDIMANKPVNGTLPIVGAEHTMNSTLGIATVTLTNGANFPTITTEEIGTTGVYFGSVRVTNNSSNEDVVLKAVRFYQAGSAATTDLANVKIVVDGQEYPAVVSSDGKYYSATFNVTVPRGLSKDIDIKGDIVNGVGRTVKFQVYEASDLYAMGATYGYGAPFTGTTFPYNVATSAITISGATVNSLTRSNEAPVANITVNKPNEVLGAFDLDLVGEGIDVTTMVVNVTLTDGTPAKNANNVITNATLVDQNGQVLAGPVDYVTTGALTGTFTFSGVTFPAGKTTIFVKGQLDANKFDSNDTVTVSTNPSAWSGVRGTQSGSVITISTGSVSANTMNVRLPNLTVSTLATPNNDLVSGATNVVLATAELDATTSGDDVRVSNVTVGTTAASTVLAGVDNVKIYADLDGDGTFETLVGTAQSFPGTAANESLSFPLNPSVTVKKGEKVQIAAIADIASGTTGTLQVTFTNASAFAVNTGVTITPTTAGSGVARTIQANGNVSVALGASNPTAKVLLDASASNNASQDVLEVKVSADNVEDLNVESITLDQTGGTSNNRAVLSYVITDGSQEWTIANTGANTLTLDMTANPLRIPAGSYKTLTVKVKTNDVSGSVSNGDSVQVNIPATGVTARGIQSQATTQAGNLTGNAHVVYEAYPSVAVAESGASKTLTNSTAMSLMKITLTNEGDKDIAFTNGDSDQIKVSILGDIAATANFKMTEVESGNTLCSGAMVSNVATCDFASNTLTIPAGGSRTVEVFADTSALTTTGNTVYGRLLDAVGTFVYDINAATDNFDVSTYVLNGDVDGPTYVKP